MSESFIIVHTLVELFSIEIGVTAKPYPPLKGAQVISWIPFSCAKFTEGIFYGLRLSLGTTYPGYVFGYNFRIL